MAQEVRDMPIRMIPHNPIPNGVATPSAASTEHPCTYTPTAFATILDTLVRDRGLSNPRLARLSGSEQSYLSRLRTGNRQPSYAVVTELADALEATDVERARMYLSANYWPWRLPDDTTLAVIRRLMEVSQ